ncbi:hypothetical protein AKJ08_1988 [Vulgatibacter incomptus]|uniref:Uncharacterized protein n=1 Tax=Vulgatibacter incomptus TaxID=1391653 RepID=A0A0K1PDV4_9BACT|nr:hypothetical protein AKJ08_1988 [Vulgatibacter incomptus]
MEYLHRFRVDILAMLGRRDFHDGTNLGVKNFRAPSGRPRMDAAAS